MFDSQRANLEEGREVPAGEDASSSTVASVTRGRRRRPSLRIQVGRVLILLAVLLAWQAVDIFSLSKSGLASSPLETWDYTWTNLLLGGELWPHLLATLTATLIAFVLASSLGIVAGLALALSRTADLLLNPYVNALNSMPRIALAPLFIIYFGITTSAKVALAFTLVFFILLENARAGAKHVDDDVILLSKALGASRRQLFVKVLLPTALPSIFAGLRLGLIYSFLGVVTSEILGSRLGLGQLIAYYSNSYQMAGVYGILIITGLVATGLNYLMIWLESHLLRWRPPS